MARRRRSETRGVGQSHSPPPAMYIIWREGRRGGEREIKTGRRRLVSSEERNVCPVGMCPESNASNILPWIYLIDLFFPPSGRWSRIINSSPPFVSNFANSSGKRGEAFRIFNGIVENFLSILARYD